MNVPDEFEAILRLAEINNTVVNISQMKEIIFYRPYIHADVEAHTGNE